MGERKGRERRGRRKKINVSSDFLYLLYSHVVIHIYLTIYVPARNYITVKSVQLPYGFYTCLDRMTYAINSEYP